MKSYFQVARKYIPDSTESTPGVHTPEYSRLVTYDWGTASHETLLAYTSNIGFLRLYIDEDNHLAEHARSDGFDIYFTDLAGNTLSFELVYYTSGTGEWWIVYPHDAPDPTLYGLPSVNNDVRPICYFYINYGDQTKNTDPTTDIWSSNANRNRIGTTLYGEDHVNGLVAHASYEIGENHADFLYNPLYESGNASGRPINSFLFDGHTSGYTALYKNTTVYDSNHVLRDYNLGNPCSLHNLPLNESPYPLYSEADLAWYNITPWLPIYQYHNLTDTYTPDGETLSILFSIKTPELFSSYGVAYNSTTGIEKTQYEYLLAYKNIMVTAEYNRTEGLWLRVGVDTGYHINTSTTNTPEYEYSIGGGQTWDLDQDTGYTFLLSIRIGTYDGTDDTYTRLIDFRGVSTNSLDYIASYNSVETIQYSRHIDRISYGNGVVEPGTHYSPYNGSNYVSNSNLVQLLEVRAPTYYFPYKAYYPGDDDHIEGVKVFERKTRLKLNTMCAMLFQNEALRTIGSASVTPAPSSSRLYIWNKPRIYQGLAGGCN